MRLYIVRHADPDYPNNTITPAGHLEARALARRMTRLRPDRIYTSPLGRAVDTMRYSADALGMTWGVEDWTRELGDCRVDLQPWGTLCVWDTPGQIIRQNPALYTGDDWDRHAPFDNPLFRQTWETLRRNSDAFIERHGYIRDGGRYRPVRPNREGIAVFCHGGLGLWWLAHLLELPLPLVWSGFWLPPSSVTTILFDQRSDDWAVPRCIGCADVSHLYEADLPTQPSGIQANFE
jgi:broad specificity phosphatase PhoE